MTNSSRQCLIVIERLGTDLLWRDVERDGPEVDLLVGVHARHDEEEAGPLGATGAEATQAEDHRPLVLLHNLRGRRGRGENFLNFTTIRCDRESLSFPKRLSGSNLLKPNWENVPACFTDE